MRNAFGLLLAFCASIPGASRLFAEEPPPKPRPVTLRVATYNAWLIPIVSKDRPRRLEKMPAALGALDLDVLCLQEVWLGADKKKLAAGLRAALPHAVQAGGGLMLLSRHPVRSWQFVEYPTFKGLSVGERLAGKGLLDAVLETPAGLVRVVTTHTALAFGPGNPRSKQLRFLRRHLATCRDLPLVVPADLNTWPVEDGHLTGDYQDLLAPGLVDANPPVRGHDRRWDPGAPTRFRWPRVKGAEGWYPDHILFRSGPSASIALERFAMVLDTPKTALSDHNLLFADLVVRPRPSKESAKKGASKGAGKGG